MCKEFGSSFSLWARARPTMSSKKCDKLKTMNSVECERQRENMNNDDMRFTVFRFNLIWLASLNTLNHKDNNIWCLFICFLPPSIDEVRLLSLISITIAATTNGVIAGAKLVKLSESIDIKIAPCSSRWVCTNESLASLTQLAASIQCSQSVQTNRQLPHRNGLNFFSGFFAH